MTFVLNFTSRIRQEYTYPKRSVVTLIMPRKILPFIFLMLGSILIFASLYLVLRDRAPQTELSAVPAQVNFPAPELTLMDIQGNSRSLADYRGQVVLINLWATWCPPCKAEMPTLQAFYEEHKESGFVIIAINDGESREDVLRFVSDYQLTFPVWLDPTYIATEQAFHTLNLPSSFVIDRDGTIQLAWVGGISSQMLEKHVVPLIKEQK
jgi:peroxiredoxin